MRRGAARRRGMMAEAAAVPLSQYVAWRDIGDAEVVPDGFGDNTLRKTTLGFGWNAGGVSTAQLNSGDGWVEMTHRRGSNTEPVNQDNIYQMIGLSNGDIDQTRLDIDFGGVFGANRLYKSENGSMGYKGGIFNGDVVRIAVEAGVVVLRLNGALKYTFVNAPVYPLLVDSSVHAGNAVTYLRSAVYKCRISFDEGDDWSAW